MTNALCHDFVLRKNCRIAHENKQASPFSMSTYGSHHVHLVSKIASTWNNLVQAPSKQEKVATTPFALLPILRKVDSGEKFGLVQSDYTTSFKGLIEMKEEVKDEDLTNLSSVSEDGENSIYGSMLHDLTSSIDPKLLRQPEPHPSVSELTSNTRHLSLRDDPRLPTPAPLTHTHILTNNTDGSIRSDPTPRTASLHPSTSTVPHPLTTILTANSVTTNFSGAVDLNRIPTTTSTVPHSNTSAEFTFTHPSPLTAEGRRPLIISPSLSPPPTNNATNSLGATKSPIPHVAEATIVPGSKRKAIDDSDAATASTTSRDVVSGQEIPFKLAKKARLSASAAPATMVRSNQPII